MVTKGPNGEPAPIETFKNKHPEIKIISTYIIQDVFDHITAGRVLASSTDLMKQQGQIAIDMMIKLLNGDQVGSKESNFPFRAGPIVPIISQDNIQQWPYEYLFGEREFKAIHVLSINQPVLLQQRSTNES